MHRATRYRDNGAVQNPPSAESEPFTLMRRVVPSVRERRDSVAIELLPGMVGQSDVMRDVERRLKRIAATEMSVLLTGESGTGKGLAARAIHRLSSRDAQPFVRVNCSALPPETLDEALFGTQSGGRV